MHRTAPWRVQSSAISPTGRSASADTGPGVSSQRGRAFLATDLTAGEPDREDTEADMRFAWVTRAEFEDRVRSGEITDAQTLAAYALLLLRSP